ncbi:lytic polysaccharide monooxygenase, partial [Streptomyces sp. NPDC001274]
LPSRASQRKEPGGSTVTHSGVLPQKSGKHLILGVWTIADTGNAFYACSDVTF